MDPKPSAQWKITFLQNEANPSDGTWSCQEGQHYFLVFDPYPVVLRIYYYLGTQATASSEPTEITWAYISWWEERGN